MSTDRFNPEQRRREKQASRDADEVALKSGAKTRGQIARENSPLSSIAGKPDFRKVGLPARSNAHREAALQRDIVVALGTMEGVIVHRNNVGTATHNGGARVAYGVGGKGAPDLVCEVRTASAWTLLWIEVKTPDGAVESHQTEWHRAARKQGRPCIVARSVEDAVDAVRFVERGCATFYDRGRNLARVEGE